MSWWILHIKLLALFQSLWHFKNKHMFTLSLLVRLLDVSQGAHFKCTLNSCNAAIDVVYLTQIIQHTCNRKHVIKFCTHCCWSYGAGLRNISCFRLLRELVLLPPAWITLFFPSQDRRIQKDVKSFKLKYFLLGILDHSPYTRHATPCTKAGAAFPLDLNNRS